MISIECNDGVILTVSEPAIRHSLMIKNMLDDLGPSDTAIPVTVGSSKVIKLVIDYLENLEKNAIADPIIADPIIAEDQKKSNTFDDDNKISDTVKQMMEFDRQNLLNMIVVADFLNIESLRIDGCTAISALIKGKTPDEIREILNIENDFSEEEKEQIRKEEAGLTI